MSISSHTRDVTRTFCVKALFLLKQSSTFSEPVSTDTTLHHMICSKVRQRIFELNRPRAKAAEKVRALSRLVPRFPTTKGFSAYSRVRSGYEIKLSPVRLRSQFSRNPTPFFFYTPRKSSSNHPNSVM